jgi:uncharacterized membrane protein YgcG
MITIDEGFSGKVIAGWIFFFAYATMILTNFTRAGKKGLKKMNKQKNFKPSSKQKKRKKVLTPKDYWQFESSGGGGSWGGSYADSGGGDSGGDGGGGE